MQKIILISAAVLGGLGVILGAFGAHALQNTLEMHNRVDTYETAVQYHFYHSLALLGIGLLMFKIAHPYLGYAAVAMILGIIIFSGSLYILCITNIRWLGAVTPLGGLSMIVGWILLVIGIIKGL